MNFRPISTEWVVCRTKQHNFEIKTKPAPLQKMPVTALGFFHQGGCC